MCFCVRACVCAFARVPSIYIIYMHINLSVRSFDDYKTSEKCSGRSVGGKRKLSYDSPLREYKSVGVVRSCTHPRTRERDALRWLPVSRAYARIWKSKWIELKKYNLQNRNYNRHSLPLPRYCLNRNIFYLFFFFFFFLLRLFFTLSSSSVFFYLEKTQRTLLFILI